MQFDVIPHPTKERKINQFVISHGEFSLPPVKAGTFGSSEYKNLSKFLTPLNELFSHLPQHVNEEVFNSYERIFQYLSEYDGIKGQCIKNIQDEVKIIFDLVEINDIIYWIKNYENSIFIPDDSAMQEHHTKDKTYTREEFIPLAALGLCCQMLLPVWATLCTLVSGEIHTQMKEVAVLEIIYSSNMYDSAAYDRLTVYVQALTGKEKVPISVAISNGMSHHQLVKWGLANALVRKLTTTEYTDPDTRVVNNIYTSIDKKLKSIETNFRNYSNDVHAYTRDSGRSGDEGGNAALLEDLKRKSKVPLGYKVALNNYCATCTPLMENLIKSDVKLNDGKPLSKAEIKDWLAEAKDLSNWLKEYGQLDVNVTALGILGALFKTQFHPSALFMVDYDPSLCNLMAVAIVYLRKTGFNEVALIPTALIEEVKGNRVMTRQMLSKEVTEEIKERYPFTYNNKKLSAEAQNPALANIASTTRFVISSFLTVNLPPAMEEELGFNPGKFDAIEVSSNFKEEYAKFILRTSYFEYDTLDYTPLSKGTRK